MRNRILKAHNHKLLSGIGTVFSPNFFLVKILSPINFFLCDRGWQRVAGGGANSCFSRTENKVLSNRNTVVVGKKTRE